MQCDFRGQLRWLLTPFLVLALATTGLAWPPGGNGGGNGGGKPGGEDPPPEPAVVNYGLLIFAMPADYQGGSVWIQEANELGEVVGYYSIGGGYEQPFYIDINDLDDDEVTFANLNDLFPDLTVLDVDPPTADVAGWQIAAANGINNFGDIALALSRDSDPEGLDELRGAVLELRPDPLDPAVGPRLHVMPDGAWSHTYARRINDAGIVLGRGDSTTSYVYQPGLHGTTADAAVEILPFLQDAWTIEMNNPTADHDTQLVWSGGSEIWRFTLGDADRVVLTTEISLSGGDSSLSDSGACSGHRNIRKNKTIGAVYDGTVIDFPDLRFARALNASGDVVGESLSSYDFMLAHETHGALNLEQLAVAATSEDQQLWDGGDILLHGITERNVLGTDPSVADFPIVFGRLRRYDTEFSFHYEAVVLLPIPPQ